MDELTEYHFLTTDNRPYVWFGNTHNPVRDALSGIVILKVILLLTIHLSDDSHDVLLFGSQHIFAFMLTTDFANLGKNLPK